ncbi:hypothetical protein MTR67_041497 [Solanum verrucosum]|uniref:F-box associated beta-propeller type 1 domain-containing protein n=1 Tax=Solanum verrucosum TaxID=315347 RepID=A0AAF0UKS6_SOLVR|nr:hypothetical protein MTR67_041497 [Solanum verrucosum]
MRSKAKQQKKIKGECSNEDTCVFSYDIIVNILIKVYAVSLLRFKCVSKSWNNMISEDVTFTKAHCEQSKIIRREKLLLQRKSGGFDFIHLNNFNEVVIDKQQFPLKGFLGAHVLCSYDGLVLLKKSKAYKQFVLWNPLFGQHQIFECPYMKSHEHTFSSAYGLCYDSITDDYKFVLIHNLFYVVYSMSKNIWTKKISLPTLQQFSHSYVWSKEISTKNHVYWSLNEKFLCHKYKTSTFIYFDAELDELKELPIPIAASEHQCLFQLSTWKGCLSAYGCNNSYSGFHIWIRQHDDWKWLMSIPNIPALNYGCYFYNYKILCCTENDELIFQGPQCHNLSIYCLKQQRFIRRVNIPNHLEYLLGHAMSICLDSLYFPKFNVTRKRKQLSTPSK